jgi:hypothetical protein
MPSGNLKRSGFWESEDAKNMYTTCPNVAGVPGGDVGLGAADPRVGGRRGVRRQHQHAASPCFGPKFGKHKHLVDDQNRAFAMLLKRTREMIKRYRPDGALIVNSASPLLHSCGVLEIHRRRHAGVVYLHLGLHGAVVRLEDALARAGHKAAALP